jgi:formylglycine-generating enzyme required for sulfatase activity
MKKFIIIIIIFFTTGCQKKNQEIPPGMVLIPAGEFIMGSNEKDPDEATASYGSKKAFFNDTNPQRKIFLKNFYIDKFEVTNMQYAEFDRSYRFSPDKQNHPVTDVNWFSARDYCTFKNKQLPSETQWEKAGRELDGKIYPWGNEFSLEKANTGRANKGGTTPVGIFENGKSYFGVYDLIGNVGEWTNDWYKPYPGNTFQDEKFGEKYRVIRGSSWGGVGHYKIDYYDQLTYRRVMEPAEKLPDLGFRCAFSG